MENLSPLECLVPSLEGTNGWAPTELLPDYLLDDMPTEYLKLDELAVDPMDVDSLARSLKLETEAAEPLDLPILSPIVAAPKAPAARPVSVESAMDSSDDSSSEEEGEGEGEVSEDDAAYSPSSSPVRPKRPQTTRQLRTLRAPRIQPPPEMALKPLAAGRMNLPGTMRPQAQRTKPGPKRGRRQVGRPPKHAMEEIDSETLRSRKRNRIAARRNRALRKARHETMLAYSAQLAVDNTKLKIAAENCREQIENLKKTIRTKYGRHGVRALLPLAFPSRK